jgi:hypothetical protein
VRPDANERAAWDAVEFDVYPIADSDDLASPASVSA